MRILGVIFLAILFGTATSYLDMVSQNEYLLFFINNQIIAISATILGFNIAAIIFLLGEITRIELQSSFNFTKSKKEIKHSIYLMIFIFLSILVLLITCPKDTNLIIDFSFKSLIMSLFFLLIYTLYEIVSSAFNLLNIDKNKE